jgi:hypothetical protein
VSKFLPDILTAIAARPKENMHSNENLQLLLFLPALKDVSAANAVLDAIVKHSERAAMALLRKTRAQDALVALVKQYGWTALEDAMEKLLNVCEGDVLVYSILSLLENLDPSLPACEEIKTWAVSQEMPDEDADEGLSNCINLALSLDDPDLLQRFVASIASGHSGLFKEELDHPEGSLTCWIMALDCFAYAHVLLWSSLRCADRGKLLDAILAVARDKSVAFSPLSFRVIMESLIMTNSEQEISRKPTIVSSLLFACPFVLTNP